jgi:hypothetical protein
MHRSRKALDKNCQHGLVEAPPLVAWTLHDLRRSAASGMAGLGTAPHVIEAVLNHRSGVIKGISATYNRFNYAAEKRAALDAWAAHVSNLVGAPTVGLLIAA